MNRWIIASGLAGALALPLLTTPGTASASCYDRKVAGTVVGGLGGALIGNSIAHGGGGAVVGGLGGAVLGHEVARSSCRHDYERYRYRHAEYYRSRYRPYRGRYETGGFASGTYPAEAQYAPAPTQQTVYYDNRGNVIYPPVATSSPTYAAAPPAAAYASGGYPVQATPACNARSYYNDRGELVQSCAP